MLSLEVSHRREQVLQRSQQGVGSVTFKAGGAGLLGGRLQGAHLGPGPVLGPGAWCCARASPAVQQAGGACVADGGVVGRGPGAGQRTQRSEEWTPLLGPRGSSTRRDRDPVGLGGRGPCEDFSPQHPSAQTVPSVPKLGAPQWR